MADLDIRDIRSLTEFQRNAREFVGSISRKRSPVVLTVNGRAALVVQDVDSYQEMVDRLERAEAAAAVRQGIAEFESGEGVSAGQAFEELRRRHGIRR